MRNHWKLSPKTEKLRQKGNYLDLIATDELTAVRCITGSFRSFAHSLGDPVAYTSSTFMAALDGACEAFRKEYIKKKSDHFKGSNASIIGRFVQVILYSDGRISTFAYGGSTVTLLRNGTAQPFQRGEIAAQAGDLIVINLEGESSTQKMIENGGLDGIENDYPLLVFQIEQESTETFIPRPRSEDISAGAAGTPTAEKVAPLAAEPTDQPTPEIPDSPRAIDAQKGSGKKSKWLGWAALMVGLGLGAWMGYPYVANQLPELTNTFYSSLPDQAKKGADEADEAGALPSAQSQSPKTDSLLKIYYAKNPRELPLLDQAIQTLEEEQGTRAPGSSGGLKTDLLKERNEVVNQLKITFNEYLSQAQIATEEGKLSRAREFLAKAERFFNNSLRGALKNDSESSSIQRDLTNRIKKVEGLRNEENTSFD